MSALQIEACDLTEVLRALEERLLQSEARHTPSQLRVLLDPGFVEYGSSGRVWDRESVIAALQQEPLDGPVPAIRDFAVKRLAPDVALATYRLVAGSGEHARASLRSSIWRLVEGSWQMLFHQGTPSDERPPAA